MRDDKWLIDRFDHIRLSYFKEIEAFDVKIKFYGRARRRLGSIKKVDDISLIRVNGLLAAANIPEFVIDEVIAHEFVHYIHGFGSSRNRIFEHPHKGRIVERELERRGASHLLRSSKSWLKSNWNDHLDLFLAK